MTNPSAGDTVKPTKTKSTTNGEVSVGARGDQFRMACTRKRRRIEPLATSAEIPEKTQRRDDSLTGNAKVHVAASCSALFVRDQDESYRNVERPTKEDEVRLTVDHVTIATITTGCHLKAAPYEPLDERSAGELENNHCQPSRKKRREEVQRDRPATETNSSALSSRRDESAKLRKTIQWLEEGARRLREDLANVRNELHEERRAAKLMKRDMESNIREARAIEAVKYQHIIAELKTRISRPSSMEPTMSCTPSSSASPVLSSSSSSSSSLRAELAREENHRREISALKRRLGEAENTIKRLKWESLNSPRKATCKANGPSCAEVRRLEAEVHCLRASNERLEDKLRIAIDAEKTRTNELRIQHENHEVELSALRKSLRTETIKMMEELRGKSREIEKLTKLVYADDSLKRRKSASRDDLPMRKLRESERNGTIRSMGRLDKKILMEDGHMMDSYIRDVDCDKAMGETEVERLRELALEQQQVIEIFRQALKEKERKLEQLSNKKRKEEFYRQWLELEPVAEVDDEEDHEEGDSALSSAPSSLSPQPGGCGQWQGNAVTREAYEAVLIEIEDLQSKLSKEKQELSYARSQVADLEKALLDETRCGGRDKEVNVLNEKLREAEEREAGLLAELSDLREQNELLEFRLLELEETPARRDSPDHAADSGVVSPEPMHLHKDEANKQRNRAVATVIPYTSNIALSSATRVVSPVPQKPPLSLQESGIFEQDEDELQVELASRGTQTEVPAGELLQEVQRLQELRARLQERAAKVSTPAACTIDITNESTVDSIVQFSSYQERIRELEERLETYEEADEKRLREKLLSKQREEELLDENYKLTERVYWLENELQNLEDIIAQDRGGEERTDRETTISTSSLAVGASELFQSSRDCFTATLARVENDETILKADCDRFNYFLPARSTNEPIVESLQMHCARCGGNRDKAKDTADFAQQCTLPVNSEITVVDGPESTLTTGIVEEVAREAKEGGDESGPEEVEEAKIQTAMVGRISQVLVLPEEPEATAFGAIEPIVSSAESEPGKKDNAAGAAW